MAELVQEAGNFYSTFNGKNNVKLIRKTLYRSNELLKWCAPVFLIDSREKVNISVDA